MAVFRAFFFRDRSATRLPAGAARHHILIQQLLAATSHGVQIYEVGQEGVAAMPKRMDSKPANKRRCCSSSSP